METANALLEKTISIYGRKTHENAPSMRLIWTLQPFRIWFFFLPMYDFELWRRLTVHRWRCTTFNAHRKSMCAKWTKSPTIVWTIKCWAIRLLFCYKLNHFVLSRTLDEIDIILISTRIHFLFFFLIELFCNTFHHFK